MASTAQTVSWIKEAICPVCLDFFTDPVLLNCGHNFCRSCITRCWESEKKKSCPECGKIFADRTLRVSRALANLAEKARNVNMNPKGKESKFFCQEHEEELKLFCETDKSLICLICRDAQEHREHRFRPIKEAVNIYKGLLNSLLDSLTKNKSDLQVKERQQNENISRVRKQSNSVQIHITSQFAELRQLIFEKEHSLLRDLREEEERILNSMEKNLQEIQENIRIIQEEISKLKEEMDQKDSLIFLKEEARQNRRITDDVQELSVRDEALPVEKFYHLYFLKTVLRETLDGINPVSVTLDVETANLYLELSENQRRVRWTRTRRHFPDTRKTFTHCPCVLGSEGLSSGRHYWEVDVAGNRVWCLGVAAETVERKEWVMLSPENGFWLIGRDDNDDDTDDDDDDAICALTFPGSHLLTCPIPGSVGVYLNYDFGRISFYNGETKSHLHTFTGNKFTGKLYPILAPSDLNQWLSICSGSTPGLESGRVPGPATGENLILNVPRVK